MNSGDVMNIKTRKFVKTVHALAAHPYTKLSLYVVGAALAVGAGQAFAAATDGTFTAANAKLSAIIAGTGGGLAGSVSLTRQLIRNSWEFQGTSLAHPLGVGLISAFGGGALTGILTATI